MTETQDWYGADVATFGDRVAAAREAAGMSRKELAKRLGVRHTTLRGWEDDISEPRANRLSMMAGLLNVSVMWLINGEGEGIPEPVEEGVMPGDLQDVLAELREIRTEMKARAERIARLEKRLRGLMSEKPDV